VSLLLLLAAATAGGLLFQALGVTGGLVIGSMLGAAAASLARSEAVTVPTPVQNGALIVLGAAIGAGVTRSTLPSLQRLLLPAVAAGLLIIVAGIAIALLMRLFGVAPAEDVLATSPGALSAVTGVALDRGVAPVEVALFHTVRILLVLVTLPLVVALLPPQPQ
jgi:uncharacterized protein